MNSYLNASEIACTVFDLMSWLIVVNKKGNKETKKT